jgi:HSP20 family protein
LLQEKVTKKEQIMTNIIKNKSAAPAAFGSVLDQLFPKTVTTLLDDTFWGLDNPSVATAAPVNILETAEGYEIELTAPGLRKSDFQLIIDEDTLTVSFEPLADKRAEKAQAGFDPGEANPNMASKWVRREFTRRPFTRHFELGDTIDRDKISARYDSGILYLTLPKMENLRPVSRQIDIS